MGLFTGFERGSGGRYIFDDDSGQLVKVSDETPKFPKNVWFPKHGYKYFDRALQKTFHSKTEKRDFLNAHNLHEAPTTESDSKRFERCAAMVNDGRVKQGLPEKTVSELRGDTIHQKV